MADDTGRRDALLEHRHLRASKVDVVGVQQALGCFGDPSLEDLDLGFRPPWEIDAGRGVVQAPQKRAGVSMDRTFRGRGDGPVTGRHSG